MECIDLTGSNELNCLIQEYKEQKAKLKKAQAKEKELKSQLFNVLNRNQVDSIICGDNILNRKVTKASKGKIVTVDMVGTIINARKGSETIVIDEFINE